MPIFLSAVNPPVITVQPDSLKLVVSGQSVQITIVANGDSLVYQWQKDGANIAGANSATYTIVMVTESDDGQYRCVVSNVATTIISTAAIVKLCKSYKYRYSKCRQSSYGWTAS